MLNFFKPIFSLKDVMDLYERDEEFHLVGYSFGSMLTLKLAKGLENFGKIGKVTTIDGSPKFLKRLALEHLPSNFSEELIQAITLTNTVFMCIPDDDGTILRAIMEEPTWDAKLTKFCELYRDKRIYTEEYAKKIINALVNRLLLTTSIDLTSFAILQRTPLTLIRPSMASLQDIDDDYGLSRYTPNQIAINTVEGNHATILENPQLAQTINSIH
jgi:fatty acid synthase, animal type